MTKISAQQQGIEDGFAGDPVGSGHPVQRLPAWSSIAPRQPTRQGNHPAWSASFFAASVAAWVVRPAETMTSTVTDDGGNEDGQGMPLHLGPQLHHAGCARTAAEDAGEVDAHLFHVIQLTQSRSSGQPAAAPAHRHWQAPAAVYRVQHLAQKTEGQNARKLKKMYFVTDRSFHGHQKMWNTGGSIPHRRTSINRDTWLRIPTHFARNCKRRTANVRCAVRSRSRNESDHIIAAGLIGQGDPARGDVAGK